MKFKKNKLGIFLFYSFEDYDLPEIGWKIHVSATFENYKEILGLVRKYCIEKAISFKHILKKQDFLFSISKNATPTFAGKFITIYPSNTKQAQVILDDLYVLLCKFQGPEILTDRSFKGSIVSYRFGVIVSDPDKFPENLKVGVYKPNEIEDPFQEPLEEGEGKFINRYKVVAIIDTSSFGSTYLAVLNNQKFVLKESRKFLGQNQSDDPILRRKHEIHILERLESGYFPKYFENFWFKKKFYTVFSYEEGLTLRDWSERITFLYSHNLEGSRKTEIENFYNRLIPKLEELLLFCKKKQLVLNDIKSSNIIWDGFENLKFVDLDFSFFSNEKSISIVNSFGRISTKNYHAKDVRNVGLLLTDLIARTSSLQNKHTNLSWIKKYFINFCLMNNVNNSLMSKTLSFLNFNNKKKLGNYKFISSSKKRLKEKKVCIFKKQEFINLNFEENIDKWVESTFSTKNNPWIDLYFSIKTLDLQTSRFLIQQLWKERTVRSYGDIFVINEERKLSNYLYFGNSYFVFLLLKFKKLFSTEDVDDKIKELLLTLQKAHFTTSSVWYGSAGVAVILLMAFQTFNNSNYFDAACKISHHLLWHYVPKYNNFFDYDGQLLSEEEKKLIFTLFGILGISI